MILEGRGLRSMYSIAVAPGISSKCSLPGTPPPAIVGATCHSYEASTTSAILKRTSTTLEQIPSISGKTSHVGLGLAFTVSVASVDSAEHRCSNVAGIAGVVAVAGISRVAGVIAVTLTL